jgi:AcrR family transcriptional regulator
MTAMVRIDQRKGRIPPRPLPRAAGAGARERILGTAYELFTRYGVGPVGVDRIVAEAGVAKTTLYRHFRSKEALAVAVLLRHEQLWTREWLEAESARRANSPEGRVLAVFDLFEEWFGQAGYDGCLFINTLLETRDHSSPARKAAIAAIENVYEFVRRLLEEAGVPDSEAVAHQIQILLRGSIVAALEGRVEAVKQGRLAAERLLGA